MKDAIPFLFHSFLLLLIYIRLPLQQHHTSPSPAYNTFIGRRSFLAFLDRVSLLHYEKQSLLARLFAIGLLDASFWRSSLACSSFRRFPTLTLHSHLLHNSTLLTKDEILTVHPRPMCTGLVRYHLCTSYYLRSVLVPLCCAAQYRAALD